METFIREGTWANEGIAYDIGIIGYCTHTS